MDQKAFEHKELVLKISEHIPNFDEKEILSFIQLIIPKIHFSLSHNEIDSTKKYCSEEIIKRILEDTYKYRISKNIDNTRVGYARLQDCEEENSKFYVKIYTSVFFYDDVENNANNKDVYDKYWNDIWVVKLEGNLGREIMNKCPSCGSLMEYNKFKHMFTCKYCRNSIYYAQVNWKIVDIEVNGMKNK